jgi:hypothetical protein
MRLLFAALMFALMAAATIVANLPANIPDAIRNADRRGGHRMVELSRIAAWPTFERAGIRWPDPAAIERAINGEWAEARRP